MRAAGIDIGSLTVKLAILEDSRLVLSRKTLTSYNPLETAKELIGDAVFDALAATGYGRHLIKGHLDCPVISEIKAFAVGSRFFSSDCSSILDIGGQDTKAISLDSDGNMRKFEMNDKCAAGTGRFLEVMATALGFSLEEFARAALSAETAVKINSTCTVFAESEVVSLTAKGVSRNEVALGIHIH
ncbi:MAG: Activator of (R)-2-hydroxyglutaryl-CoA dehydratase [Syntrophus sp. PtaU1.Bin208]|nr:MAG: Activator of (R)-2-hydroxyglutaryl-CoA dehydratase [Syntrophus sp. PtaU1.Bin208]